ncbi:hypothetical protein A9K97_gp359 [Tokyovirus A1]|uniref:hypothetical protein n=1 Tax=Tokyovirus A1 TaxID=1826170 RepID=UPI0007A98981|nr:hypothetical protein A9K97_gp359 [Tokyovirus A1]BAU79992.1 hypothetical protein [Tokyovirus A1]
MFFVRRFEGNPLYVDESVLAEEEADDEMPELLTETDEDETLQGETLDSIRDEVYGGFDHGGAFNVLCPCCDKYKGQKDVLVLVRGNTSPSVESFTEFSKFESNIWF